MKKLFGLSLFLLLGCAYDPISGPDRQHNERPNPYGVPTNAPPARMMVPGAGLPR